LVISGIVLKAAVCVKSNTWTVWSYTTCSARKQPVAWGKVVVNGIWTAHMWRRKQLLL